MFQNVSWQFIYEHSGALRHSSNTMSRRCFYAFDFVAFYYFCVMCLNVNPRVNTCANSLLIDCIWVWYYVMKLKFAAVGWFSKVLKQIKIEDLHAFDVAVFYNCCLMMSVPWKYQHVALCSFYNRFSNVSWTNIF